MARNNRGKYENQPPVKMEDKIPIHDRLWIHRKIGSQSLLDLTDVSQLFKREDRAYRNQSPLHMTTMYYEEVSRAIRESTGSIAPLDVYQKLLPLFPPSAKEPVIAKLGDIQQYSGRIGVEVYYPEFANERIIIEEVVSDMLQTPFQPLSRPHISLARGRVGRLTNLDEIQEAMPAVITLSRMYNGGGEMI